MKIFNYLIIVLFVGFAFSSCKKEKKAKPFSTIKLVDYNGELASGTIKRIDTFPSKYVRPRTVDVWLPSNYSKNEKYAVLYMHDGQMLFDSTTTWNKQEWKVDEIVGGLIDSRKIKNTIVVAIWNHSDIRWAEYFPKKTFALTPQKFQDSMVSVATEKLGKKNVEFQSENYLKFIVEELKPFVDARFSVKTNLENTVIAGSSMGGLISMYAICEYPDIFGGAACLSTHWIGVNNFENNPFPESFFSYMEQNLPSAKNHNIYFDYGTTTLDQYYLPYQHRVDEVLKEKGFNDTNYKNLKFEGHDHSENAWNKRFQIPVEFLLKK